MIEIDRETWWDLFKWKLKVASVVTAIAIIPCIVIAFVLAWTPLKVMSHYATEDFMIFLCRLIYGGACVIAATIGWTYACRKANQMLGIERRYRWR
jgi:hypothetical protein